MGGKGGGGGGTDYGSMFSAMAAAQAAEKQYQLGMEQLNWAKQTYNEFKPYMIEGTEQSLADQKFQSDMSHQQWDTYNQTYKPIELEFAKDAESWDSPERRERMAGQSQAVIASQFEQARTAAQQQLESYGVDPTSTRFASLDLGTRVQQAAAAAGAGTKAIQDVENTGLQLKSNAVNVGRGYQSNINQTTGVGTDAGSSGVGGMTSFFNTSSNAMTAPVGWFNAGNSAQSNAINAWNNAYRNPVYAQQVKQQGQSQMMQGASGLLNSIMSLEDGGAIPDVQSQEVFMLPAPAPTQGAIPQEGGHVPMAASPSRGAIPDDVDAKLSPNEFVIPADVVLWEGQKNIYKMVDKAKAERAQVEATTETRPSVSQGIPDPSPDFVSRSGANAIPV
jgi:hypothetical protein